MNRILNRLEEIVTAAVLVGMLLLTFSQVLMRYAFNAGWVWSLEATTTLFGALLMVGISYAMRQHAHMNVDALVNTLPRAARRACTLTAILLCFAYVGLMIWGGAVLVDHLKAIGTDARDLPIKRWMIMSMIPFGFLLFGFRLAQVAVEVIRGERDTLGGAHGHAKEQSAAPAAQAASR